MNEAPPDSSDVGSMKRRKEDEGTHPGAKKVRKDLSRYHDIHLDLDDVLKTGLETLTESWQNGVPLKNLVDEGGALVDKCETIFDPFRCFFIKDFLAPGNLPTGSSGANWLEELQEEIRAIPTELKHSDLHQFWQSEDLASISFDPKNPTECEYPALVKIRELMKRGGREWMEQLTGLELQADHVPMTVSRYEYTDHLLCHDDELEGRRIAFVLYFCKDWTEKDGGQLQLYGIDDDGEPSAHPRRSLSPGQNCLSFFEVSERSFHQVAEVLRRSEADCRLSVNGWFMGRPLHPRQSLKDPPPPKLLPLTTVPESLLASWISPEIYEQRHDVRRTFVEDSEVVLHDFLKEEKFQELLEDLETYGDRFQLNSVPHKRNYWCLNDLPVNSVLEECQNLFLSEAFLVFLTELTGAALHPDGVRNNHLIDSNQSSSDEPDSDPSTNDAECRTKMVSEWRRFGHGNYSIVHDDDWSLEPDGGERFCLDARLIVARDGWDSEFGGGIGYVTGEDSTEECECMPPYPNSLLVTFRDRTVRRFVSYVDDRVNRRKENAVRPCIHDCLLTYYEETD